MTSRNRQIVDAFYAAIPALDIAKLTATIEDGFAPDAVLRVPESLLYGGIHRGREVIKGMLTTLIRTRTPMVLPTSIRLVRVADAGDDIVIEAEFEWLAPGASTPIPMRAMQWLTFRDGQVVDLTVCYWDTAACERAMAGSAE